MKRYYLLVLTCIFSMSVMASNIVNEQEYYQFIKQVKCVTCQGQSVADSYAPMALTMRKEIHRQFEEGNTQQEIREVLIQRYGESVFFAPEVKSKHFLIWLMPVVIFILGAFGLKRLLT